MSLPVLLTKTNANSFLIKISTTGSIAGEIFSEKSTYGGHKIRVIQVLCTEDYFLIEYEKVNEK